MIQVEFYPSEIIGRSKGVSARKCNKWEVEEGKDYCLSCRNKKSNRLVKAGEAAVAVMLVVAFILWETKKEA